MAKVLDQELFMSFYGDDFTGSTDAMESLTFNGVPTALFLAPPSFEEVKKFRLKTSWQEENTLMAFGVAGISRSLSPAQMDDELPPIFEKLSRIPVDFFHYKICSTFDSSPETGSIGYATDLAYRWFPSAYIPLVVGAPALKRFVMFGNLFATVDGVTYRIDRHPTMSQHPVTPMHESDLRLHLGKQTSRPVHLIELFHLEGDDHQLETVFENLSGKKGDFVLFDTYNPTHLLNTGKVLCQKKEKEKQLLIGSSGVENALCEYLQKSGRLQKSTFPASPGQRQQFVAMAGSCSPVTQKQIEWAVQKGGCEIRIDTLRLINTEQREAEIQRVKERALNDLNQGKSIVIYTAKGPEDPAIKVTIENRTGKENVGKLLGSAQGEILKGILEKTGKIRTIVAGGDTSGFVARALGIYALEARMPIAPGGPLCIAHSSHPDFDGLEISLKGGQVGNERYFEFIRLGEAKY